MQPMQPILLSYEAPFRSNLQKNTGPVSCMQRSPLNQWFYDNSKIGCIHFLYVAISPRPSLTHGITDSLFD